MNYEINKKLINPIFRDFRLPRRNAMETGVFRG